MATLKQRIIKRIPSIISTKTGLLKLNEDQKEALADRLEIFLKLESAVMIENQGKHVGMREIKAISMN